MEPNPEMMQSIEEHQEVPKKEMSVKSSGAKERTWGKCGSRKNLTIASRRMTRRAGVAWHKRNVRKDRTRNQVEQGALKG
jgi:hypothetical protein